MVQDMMDEYGAYVDFLWVPYKLGLCSRHTRMSALSAALNNIIKKQDKIT